MSIDTAPILVACTTIVFIAAGKVASRKAGAQTDMYSLHEAPALAKHACMHQTIAECGTGRIEIIHQAELSCFQWLKVLNVSAG